METTDRTMSLVFRWFFGGFVLLGSAFLLFASWCFSTSWNDGSHQWPHGFDAFLAFGIFPYFAFCFITCLPRVGPRMLKYGGIVAHVYLLLWVLGSFIKLGLLALFAFVGPAVFFTFMWRVMAALRYKAEFPTKRSSELPPKASTGSRSGPKCFSCHSAIPARVETCPKCGQQLW